jgi:hypothetical protein
MADTSITTYELTGKPETDLGFVLSKRGEMILSVAAPNVREDTTWLLRAKLAISQSACADLLKTRKGMDSALKMIEEVGTLGLSFGGAKPTVYPVPLGGECKPVYSAPGIRHAACYGVGAILARVPHLFTIREGDYLRTEQGVVGKPKGKIHFKEGGEDPFDPNRGKIRGWLLHLEYKDGRPDVIASCAFDKAKSIQKAYPGSGGPMYTKSPEEADEKTATKYMLREVFGEVSELAKAITDFDAEEEAREAGAGVKAAPVMRDVTDRLGAKLDNATAGMKAAEPVAEEPELEDEPQPEAASTSAEPETEELFK